MQNGFQPRAQVAEEGSDGKASWRRTGLDAITQASRTILFRRGSGKP